MKKIQITAQVPEKKDALGKVIQKRLGPAIVSIDYGESATESTKMFGEESMNSNALANFKVTVQSGIRTALKAGLDQVAIQAKFAAAKMGVATSGGGVDSIQVYMATFASATPQQQAEMIADLKKRAAENK